MCIYLSNDFSFFDTLTLWWIYWLGDCVEATEISLQNSGKKAHKDDCIEKQIVLSNKLGTNVYCIVVCAALQYTRRRVGDCVEWVGTSFQPNGVSRRERRLQLPFANFPSLAARHFSVDETRIQLTCVAFPTGWGKTITIHTECSRVWRLKVASQYDHHDAPRSSMACFFSP